MPDGAARPARLLTRAELRRYLGGISAAELADRIAARQLPRPLWGLPPEDARARWDQRAVDRALDAASGLLVSVETATATLDRALGLGR